MRRAVLLPCALGLLTAPSAFAQQLPLAPSIPGSAVPRAFATIAAHEDQRISGPELLPFLSDPDPAVRGRAALAIGRIGHPPDVGALGALLADPDPGVRRLAAFALGQIEDSASATPLIRLLRQGIEENPAVRAAAVEALGKLRAAPEACRAALSDPAPEVRAAALLAAWRIPVPGCVQEVLRLSNETSADIRWPAAYCLMRLVGAPASGRTAIPEPPPIPPQERAKIDARLSALLADSDVRVRLQAARGLSAFSDTATTRTLLRATADPDWRVRVEAVRALAAPLADDGHGKKQGSRQIPPPGIEPLLRDHNPNVRVVALEALARIGPPRTAIARLRSFLSDPRPQIVLASYSSLLARYRTTGDPLPEESVDAVDNLTHGLMRRKDWSIRAGAAGAVDLLPLETALPILENLLHDEPRVAKTAIEPLLERRARSGKGRLLPRLKPDLDPLLACRDPAEREIAIGATSALLADSTLPVTESDRLEFEKILTGAAEFSRENDTGADVRRAIVEAASAESGRPGMRALLTRLCSDPDYVVRREACAVLREAGTTPPRDPEPAVGGRREEDYLAILEWARTDHWAVMDTEGGTLVIRLLSRDAPLTCWNFTRLANSGFYDRGQWHRVVPDFVLQDGCPRGDGYGGAPEEIRCEINPQHFTAWTLGMALSGKDTGSSQFFLTHSDQPHLDGRYTVFGRLESGMHPADEITQGTPILTVRVVDRQP